MGIDGNRRQQQQKEEALQLVVRNLRRKYEWRGLLVVQLGRNEEEAKVFKAHAVPQGLCENVINALNLLAKQQKDGDSLIQNIVTGSREREMQGTSYEWSEKLHCIGQLWCRGGGPPA